MTNLVTLLRNRVRRNSQQLAYLFLKDGVQEQEQISMSELDERARTIAVYLQNKNLYGKRVILLYPAGIDFICAFMGCLYAGVTAIPVPLPKEGEFDKTSLLIQAIAKDAEISGVFTDSWYIKKVETIFAKHDCDNFFITLTTKFDPDSSVIYQLPPLEDETIAYLQYTSGSTSSPKGVIVKHKNLNHTLKYTAKVWCYKKNSVTLTWAPHFHVYGLICGLLVPLYHGTPAIIMPTEVFIQNPLLWLKAITQYHVTHSGCPNFGYELCLEQIKDHDLNQLNLSTWQVAVNGGENIQATTLEKFYHKFKNCGFSLNHFSPAYGMSEATGAIAVNKYGKEPIIFNLSAEDLQSNVAKIGEPYDKTRKFVSSGRLLPGIEALIVDPDNLTVQKDGKIGEIWLAGKPIVDGYWRQAELNKDVLRTLPYSNRIYLRTGDLGFSYKKELCLTGRLKEVIVLNGKKYYPLDLENTIKEALTSLPVGNNCAAFSVEVNQKENAVIAIEVMNDISVELQENIIAKIRHIILDRYGIHLHEVILVELNSLPKTASGKLQRKACQQLFKNKGLKAINTPAIKPPRLVAIDPPFLQSELKNNSTEEFINLVAAVLQISPHTIKLNAPISIYNFDSIKIVQLTNKLNETYGFSITPATLFEYKTLHEFYNKLINKISNTPIPLPSLLETVGNSVDAEIKPLRIENKSSDIAIIGISAILPGAENPEQFWTNLIEGKIVISDIPENRAYFKNGFDNEKTITRAGYVEDIDVFDAEFFNISPREAELTDPQQRLFLHVAWNAIEDAGYSTTALANIKTGLYVGVFNHDYAELLQKHNITDPYLTTGVMNSILANRVSYLLNLNGPSETIDTACSSSLVAIHHAVSAIQQGDCDVALVGGVNAILSPTTTIVADKAGMLSPDGLCKTFDKDANGYVRSEGFIAILLKPLAKAVEDCDHIYGIIKGTAVNHGGHVSSLTVPNPNAQSDVIVEAIRRSGVTINTINYIETHGTGTAIGDPIEVNGLKKAFQQLAQEQGVELEQNFCALGAVKTNIGHLESAAGLAGVLKVLLAMQHQQIPANLNFKEINPYVELDKTPFVITNQLHSWTRMKNQSGQEVPLRAGISSFGFGGTNAHVLLEEYRTVSNIVVPAYPVLIVLSAKSKRALKQKIQDLYDWVLKHADSYSLASLSFTLNTGREHFAERCAIVIDTKEELLVSLSQLLRDKTPNNTLLNSASMSTKKNRPIFNELFNKLNNEMQTAKTTLSPTELKQKLLLLADFYGEGYPIDWNNLYIGKSHRLPLPTYPFAKDKFWLNTFRSDQPISVLQENSMTSKNLATQLKNEFVQVAANILKINTNKISLTTALSELGFDSISFKELAAKLADNYNIEFTPALFFTYNNIEDITQYLITHHGDQISQGTLGNSINKLNVSTTSEIKPLLTVNNDEPIAIVGMHAYLPQSKNLNEFWEHLENGKNLVDEIPIERWDWRLYYGDSKLNNNKTNSKWGAIINDVDKFDAGFFNISAREADLMDPQHRLLMEVVWKTLEDAGCDPFSLSGKDVGIFAGVEFSEYQALIHAEDKIFHGHTATGTSHALLANRISYFLNLRGPSEVIDTACSSSLVALHRAVNAIRHGECQLAIASGVSLMLDPHTFVITSQLGALSPEGQCKTFDKSANGYVKGEGVIALLLKPLSLAKQEHDYIYGIIKGTAVNHGGKSQSLTAPNAITQSKLLEKVYKQANIPPETVTYIETHGTGTELGDPVEIEGLKQAFNTLLTDQSYSQPFCGLGSVKTNIGHLEPASGLAGVVKVLLAMHHGKLPALLHFNELNPYIKLEDSPFYIVNQNKAWERLKDKDDQDIPRRAGVSSFGFGGTCAHVVLEEAVLTKQITSQHKPYYLITLSAKQESSLQQKIIDLHTWLKTNFSKVDLEALSYTLNTGRAHFDVRCSIVVNSLNELLNSLQMLVSKQAPTNVLFSTKKNDSDFSEVYKSTINSLKEYLTMPAQLYREKLLELARLYVNYVPIDWLILHCEENQQKINALPSYPFVKQRYWFDREEVSVPASKENSFPVDLNEYTQDYLKRIFAEKLRINPDQIDIDTTYEVYGVDSLIGLEITNRLEVDFGTLPKTLLYEKSCIRDLSQYLIYKYNSILQQLSGSTAADVVIKNDATSNQELTKITSRGSQSDIAIIGLSGIFPMANNMQEFWENLRQGKDCITEIPADRWNYKDYPVQVGGETKYYNKGGFIPDVDKFDPLFFGIAPRDANLMDPQERLFLQTSWNTLEDAGYTREKLRKVANNNVGVFAGVTYNFYPLFIAEEWNKNNRIPLDIQLFSIANRVSYFLNFNGPSYVVDTACSSSLAAIHLACESLRNGECQMAIAGGVNLTLHPSKYHFLGSYSFMSDQGRCASFAEGGAGYVPSEGVGAVLLKPLEQAIRDQDHIYGVIKASSMNHGGKTSGYTVPNPNAQGELIKTALQKANIDPRTISYIEAHGTGTALGDPIEVRGLQEAFEAFTPEKEFCAIGSVKSNIGHLESAAGISQLAKVLLQMQHKQLVPSIHAEKLNPFIDFKQTPFYVQKQLSDWLVPAGNLRRAGVSSFGAGGANIHVIIEEYENKIVRSEPNLPYIFLLSAMNTERLQEYVRQVCQFLISSKTQHADLDLWLRQCCYTTQVGRESMPARLGILTNNYDELLSHLRSYLENPQSTANRWTNVINTQASVQNIKDYLNSQAYDKLIEAWSMGAKIDWESVYNVKPGITYLPPYPFVKRRCWVTNEGLTTASLMSIETKSSETSQQHRWEQKEIKQINNNPISGHWLIFSDKELGFLFQDELGKENCWYCFQDKEFKQHSKNVFYLNPDRYEDYYKLFLQVYEDNKAKLQGIIYLWSFNKDQQHYDGVYKLLHLFHALLQQKWLNTAKFALISRGSQMVTATDSLHDHQNSLWPIANSFSTQQHNHQILLLDLDSNKSLRDEARNIHHELACFQSSENQIAYRDNKRFVLRNSQAEKVVVEDHVELVDTELLETQFVPDIPPEVNIPANANNPDYSNHMNLEKVTNIVIDTLANLLGLAITEIDNEVPFQNYGMDSIIGINFAAEINNHFPGALSPMDLYRYPTTNQLINYLISRESETTDIVATIEDKSVNSEEQFMEEIAHLSETELNELLEKELLDI